MSFSVYILTSLKRPRTYVGYSANVKRRLLDHNRGRVNATKFFRPWKLIHVEAKTSFIEARLREKYWKSGAGRRNIKRILRGSPPHLKG